MSDVLKIQSLTAFQLPVELRKPVAHASHSRSLNQSLIIRCELTDGSVGWGEGLPRTYVTGESIESVWRHLTQSDFAPWLEHEFADADEAALKLSNFQLANVAADEGIKKRECFGNVVRCALELAVIDACCRARNESVGRLLRRTAESLGLAARLDAVRYSGVVTSAHGIRQWRSAVRMKLFGFQQVKVKVGTEGIDDRRLLSRLRRVLGRDVDLRLDANEAWRPDDVKKKIDPLLPFDPTCVEQPVGHEFAGDLADIRRDLCLPIMLDESLCCVEDAYRAIAAGTCDLFNLRISKCGGLMNCLTLASIARKAGLGYQLGCQVGETGILSAAGRHFACNVSGNRYLEGSYDRFLVKDAFTKENLTFGFGGRAPRLIGPGLGITVTETTIRRKSVRTQSLVER